MLDPLINLMGGVDSNDNSAAALLMGQFVTLAAKRSIAVMIAHHAAKGRDPKSAESAMGATSFVNLSRIVSNLSHWLRMMQAFLAFPPWEAKSVFRVLGTKQNFSPPNAEDRWYRISAVEIQNQQPPIYVNGDKVAVIEVFQPGASGPVFPHQLIRDALVAVDLASPPLTPASQSRTRYAAPVIARAIAHHRGGRVSDADGKAVLDHLIGVGLVHVISVKMRRTGGRSDDLNGLVLTPAGKVVIGPANQAPNNSPQSPQKSRSVINGGCRECGRGPPSGSPALLGGCGGVRAGHINAGGIVDPHAARMPPPPPAHESSTPSPCSPAATSPQPGQASAFAAYSNFAFRYLDQPMLRHMPAAEPPFTPR